MPSVSIVIPARYRVDLLEDTLVSVLEKRPRDAEVLVVHHGNYSDPYDLADEVRFVRVDPQASFAEIIQAGALASQGAVTHLLASGMRVTEGWLEPAMASFESDVCGAVTPVIMDDEGHMLSCGIHCGLAGSRKWTRKRNRSRSIGPPFEAAFFRRDLLLDLLEVNLRSNELSYETLNVSLDWSLQVLGFHTDYVSDCRVLGPPPTMPTGSAFRAGSSAERLVLRHAEQIGRWRAVLLHPLACTHQFVLDIVRGSAFQRLLGRVWGISNVADARRHEAALLQLMMEYSTSAAEAGVDEAPTESITIPISRARRSRLRHDHDDFYPQARAG